MTRLAFVAIFAAAFAAPVAADEEGGLEKAQARALLAQGNALFEKGDLRGALVDFRAAYALYPSPKLLVNAAAAERELGDLAGAANDLRHFLDESDDDPFLVDRARTDLRALERRVGRVALVGWPARTTLEIDGRPARELTYVKPGEHRVRIRPPSGNSVERDVDLSPGESVDLPALATVDLTPRLPPPPPRRTRWWIPVTVVASILVVGGAVGIGLWLGLWPPSGSPFKSDLGIFKFSDFH